MRFNLLALALSSLFSLSSFAVEKYVCVEYDRGTGKLKQQTVVLTSLDKTPLKEGRPGKFLLELYQGAGTVEAISTEGRADLEDVQLNFESVNKKVNFTIFLDELNESSLSINGKDAGDFICR